MNRKISINLALALVIIAMAVTFSVTMILSQSLFENTVASVRQKETQYEKLAEIDKTVRENSYYAIDDELLYDMLGTGYMAGISDLNARYYTAEQYVDYLDEQSGTSIGIGVDIIKEPTKYPRVIRTYLSSPAFDLGIVNGYTLISVDGTDLKNLSLNAINTLLKGTDGSTLELVYADIQGEVSSPIVVQRRRYDTPTVEFAQNENEVVGYVKILDFNSQTESELAAAIENMQNSGQGLQGLVIDLRDNDGGNLDSALDTLDVLLPAGPMAYGLNKDGTAEVLEISDNANQVEVPVVALVNGQTQAGAELFAAGIRDFGVGQIVGTQTSGKGSIQSEPLRLTDGSAVSYTVGIILTGENEEFNGVGITPNVEVLLREDELAMYYDLNIISDSQIMRAKEVVLNLTGIESETNAQANPQPSIENDDTTSEGPLDTSTDDSTAQSQTAEQTDDDDSMSGAVSEQADDTDESEDDSSDTDSSDSEDDSETDEETDPGDT